MLNIPQPIQGLTSEQASGLLLKNGPNALTFYKKKKFLTIVLQLVKDPMIILLLTAGLIYFLSGKIQDGIFLSLAILFQSVVSTYQFNRSQNALEQLKEVTQSKSKVIRDGETKEINSTDVVVGDHLLVEEGTFVSADGIVEYISDFTVNESLLTGESLPVTKALQQNIYNGTTVISGIAIAKVSATGMQTELGKIGKSLEDITEEKTPLEIVINRFVKNMAIAGSIVFGIVWIINFSKSQEVITSLLESLTLAMSILPEEIPVAFTTFMALGTWRLMKMNIIAKQMKTVETLGCATTICIDKTGTITENKMTLAKIVPANDSLVVDASNIHSIEAKRLITYAMWASEPIPFDPMEKDIHRVYTDCTDHDNRGNFKLIHEYPLGGVPPMMTHVFEDAAGSRIIATKGAPEAVMQQSSLSESEQLQIRNNINLLSQQGYRVLGVASGDASNNHLPDTQNELTLVFEGLLAFYDPPKQHIQKVLSDFYQAGIHVNIITGDHTQTTLAIAKQIGFKHNGNVMTGAELMTLNNGELKARVANTNIFTRMFPDAKLRVITTLKELHETVVMTGDGINDGPALKAAHIGVAMGKKGTDVAKQAASLVLLDDDLSAIVNAIAMGRRIYANLKKAIQYIISIHIPIILVVFIPLLFNWPYPHIFDPIHIIFLEMIMGPTCSIIFENEPMEKDMMSQKPRIQGTNFLQWRELSTSITQGIAITLGTLWVYHYSVFNGGTEAYTRTMVFTSLVVANIFLTLSNRSFYDSIFTTLFYKNNLVLIIIGITTTLLGLILYSGYLRGVFTFERLQTSDLLFSIAMGIVSVLWYELVKLRKRHKASRPLSTKADEVENTAN